MGFVLPVASGIIFSLCLYKLTRRFFSPQEERLCATNNATDWRFISALMLIVGATWVSFLFLYAILQYPDCSLDDALKAVFIQLDVNHYVNIAKFGYGTGEAFHEQELMIVFFPLWPMLLKTVHVIVPIGWYVLGTVLQIPIFVVGMTMFYMVASKHYNQRTTKLGLLLLLVSPGAFFFLMPMTESLFFALCMLSFWAIENKRFLSFAIVGYAAALTRSPGVLLVLPAVVVAANEFKKKNGAKQWLPWIGAACGPALGIGTYLFINFKIYGDWFAFSDFQWNHWAQRLGLFCNTIKYHQEYFWGGIHDNTRFALVVSLMAILVIMGQLVGVWLGSNNMPLHFGFYSLAYIFLVDGATWLLSAPRYALCLPFVHLAISEKLRNPTFKALFLIPLSMISVLYLVEFLQHAPVY